MKNRVSARVGVLLRSALVMVIGACAVARSPAAHADTILKAATTMVFGSAADTYSLIAPSAGTVTAELSNVPWPQALSALSFNMSTATDILTPEGSGRAQALAATDGSAQGPQIETYQVGAGTYFAHVSATAAGSLNLGLYSVLFTFAPSAVPLPGTIGILLIGLMVFFGLRHTIRSTATAIEDATSGSARA